MNHIKPFTGVLGRNSRIICDELLAEDESISPTLKQTIVPWALISIDPRLPEKVERDFGHLMKNNVTLAELQITIFQQIP